MIDTAVKPATMCSSATVRPLRGTVADPPSGSATAAVLFGPDGRRCSDPVQALSAMIAIAARIGMAMIRRMTGVSPLSPRPIMIDAWLVWSS